MRMMKRLLAAALGVAMAASLFAGLNLHTFAADDTYTRAQMERVIADTAIAYYLKGPDGQYDSYTLSGLSKTKSCVSRLTFGVSPEECSPQRRFYTVCSSYPHLVYYEVFGQHPLLEADMANTELPGYSRMRRYAGPPESALTDEAMMYTLSYISLTSNYGAYGKKVADNRDGWVGKGGTGAATTMRTSPTRSIRRSRRTCVRAISSPLCAARRRTTTARTAATR